MEAYRERQDELGLVILDIDLPRRSGLECLREIRARDASIPVILISGNPEFEMSEERRVTFLQKPFALSELSELVARTISRDP